MIIILKDVDTHYTLLQGYAILGDVILSYLVLDGKNRIFRGLSTSPCVSPTCYADNDMFFITSSKVS